MFFRRERCFWLHIYDAALINLVQNRDKITFFIVYYIYMIRKLFQVNSSHQYIINLAAFVDGADMWWNLCLL